jgi:hypothetical protein
VSSYWCNVRKSIPYSVHFENEKTSADVPIDTCSYVKQSGAVCSDKVCTLTSTGEAGEACSDR